MCEEKIDAFHTNIQMEMTELKTYYSIKGKFEEFP
jgi:hypothetical protein